MTTKNILRDRKITHFSSKRVCITGCKCNAGEYAESDAIMRLKFVCYKEFVQKKQVRQGTSKKMPF